MSCGLDPAVQAPVRNAQRRCHHPKPISLTLARSPVRHRLGLQRRRVAPLKPTSPSILARRGFSKLNECGIQHHYIPVSSAAVDRKVQVDRAKLFTPWLVKETERLAPAE